MVFELLLYMPCFACLFWMILLTLMASRTRIYGPLMGIVIVGGIFIFASSCCIAPNSPMQLRMIGSVLRVVTGTSLIPLFWLYMQRLRGEGPFQFVQFSWLLLPAALGATIIVLAILAGPEAVMESMPIFFSGAGLPSDKIIRTYYFVSGPINFTAIAIEAIVYIILYVRMMRKENLRFSHLYKFQQGYSLRVPELQSYYVFIFWAVFLFVIFTPYMVLVEHPWISICLSVLLTVSFFQFCYISLFAEKTTISRDELRQGFCFNYNCETKNATLEKVIHKMLDEADPATRKRVFSQLGANLPYEDLHPIDTTPESPESPAAQIFSAVAKTWDDDSLLSRFERLIFGKQLFLEPGLTLVDVADKLHTNKTYVSRLVNNTYEMPFPDLINTLRVDFAEQYISSHPDARQNEIAQACGFSSASSFNNIFKKVTGVTPKIWLATNKR